METLSADDQFIIEYRLLEIYHRKRKARFSVTLQSGPAKYQQQSQVCERTISTTRRVPASADTDTFEHVADKLTDIVNSGSPAQDQAATEIDVIQRLIELLKEYGDKVNEKITKDTELISYLQGLISFNLFENLTSAFIRSMVPREKENNQKMKIAWIFEMTSRLSALDLHPMNRIMGFGAQYVHQHFGPWIQQHGGWENAFKIHEGDEGQ